MVTEVENEMVILFLNVGVRRWADDHHYGIWRNPNLNHYRFKILKSDFDFNFQPILSQKFSLFPFSLSLLMPAFAASLHEELSLAGT